MLEKKDDLTKPNPSSQTEPLKPVAMDRAALWWNLYLDNNTYARHHETLRHQATALVVTLTGAVLTVVGWKGPTETASAISKDEWIFGAFLMLLALLGAVFSLKQYERAELHLAYANHYRKRLGDGWIGRTWQSGVIPGAKLDAVRKTVHNFHKSNFPVPWIISVPLYLMWLSANAIVYIIGALIACRGTVGTSFTVVLSTLVLLFILRIFRLNPRRAWRQREQLLAGTGNASRPPPVQKAIATTAEPKRARGIAGPRLTVALSILVLLFIVKVFRLNPR